MNLILHYDSNSHPSASSAREMLISFLPFDTLEKWIAPLRFRILLLMLLLIPASSYAQAIAGGERHSLSICSDSTARAWGRNDLGQLGIGNDTDSNVPLQVSGLTGVVAVAGGAGNSLALRKDSSVWAWGNNPGIDTTFGPTKVPVRVKSLSGVIAISGGLSHALAVKNGGTVWAWGFNNSGQLGNGTWDFFSSVPVQTSTLTGVTAVAGGGFHSIALKNDSTVWAWGNNADGQLGNGSDTSSNVPVRVTSLSGITAVAAGYHHSLALRTDSTVWVWGYNGFGQLGNGSDTNSKVPVQVIGLTGVIAISGGGYFCLALKSDSTVWAWGSNGSGQLGNGSPGGFVNLAFQVPDFSGISAVAAGYAHALALKNDGTVWVWGDNLYGQLGIGSNSASYVPVQVTGLCQGPTGVDQGDDVSDAFELLQTYPNPFNPTATIEYHLFATSLVRLSVFNILGSEIAVLVNNVEAAGEHRITFDGSSLPAGVYFYRMQAGKLQDTRKFILLK